MVKKLIKYDFRSYLRLLLPVQLILIGIAALNRFIQIFENTKSDIYNNIFVSSVVLYVIAVIVTSLLTSIVAIVRFYQGMYTNEGYLNHTLPVTPAQHIWAKLLISFIFDLGTVLAFFLSFMVITAGDMNLEIFKAAGYLIGKMFGEFGSETVLYAIELLVFMTVVQLTAYLMLYFCISVGQLARKKKILLAFGVFFGLYVITQIIATVIIITVTLNFAFVENVFKWIADNGHAAAHIIICSEILISAVLGLVYFLITKFIMSKKLNLT